MTVISKEEIINILKPILKDCGFKKRKATWHKIKDEFIFVINVQRSQWGPEYYINLGVYLRALGSELTPPVNLCHIQARVEHNNRTVESIVEDAMAWFNTHSSIEALKKLHIENKLPLMTFVKVKEFLENIDIQQN
jgi:hypothetical protein